MKCDSYSCKGESHISSGKPCQDRSAHYSDPETRVYIAIVSDGHGGDRYFRSDVGAEFVANITQDSLLEFFSSIKEKNKKSKYPLFRSKPFTQVGTVRESTSDNPRSSEEDKAIVQLLTAIVARWKEKVSEHAEKTPLSAWERENVKPEYLTAFQNGDQIEKTYGCTLMAYAQCDEFWLAFHLGDGKCIMFDRDNHCTEPVLWDEKCFLNRTTSICDPSPIDEFRYSYCGDGSYPFAIFLGSDGIDDSYGDGEKLHNFYKNILRLLEKEGDVIVHTGLEESLPMISKRGSQDDMSVAFVYDETFLHEGITALTKEQIGLLELELADICDRLNAKKRTIDELAGDYESKAARLKKGDNSSKEFKACEKVRINLKYADSDYRSIEKERTAILDQIKSLYEFLGETPKDYDLEEFVPVYLDRITSFIDGSYARECQEETVVPSTDTIVENTELHEGEPSSVPAVLENSESAPIADSQEVPPEEIRQVLEESAKWANIIQNSAQNSQSHGEKE